MNRRCLKSLDRFRIGQAATLALGKMMTTARSNTRPKYRLDAGPGAVTIKTWLPSNLNFLLMHSTGPPHAATPLHGFGRAQAVSRTRLLHVGLQRASPGRVSAQRKLGSCDAVVGA